MPGTRRSVMSSVEHTRTARCQRVWILSLQPFMPECGPFASKTDHRKTNTKRLHKGVDGIVDVMPKQRFHVKMSRRLSRGRLRSWGSAANDTLTR